MAVTVGARYALGRDATLNAPYFYTAITRTRLLLHLGIFNHFTFTFERHKTLYFYMGTRRTGPGCESPRVPTQ